MASISTLRNTLLDEANAIQRRYAASAHPNERKELETRYAEIDRQLGELPVEQNPPDKYQIKASKGAENKYEIKRCPYCAETINIAAIKCRFCGEMLNSSMGLVNVSGRKPIWNRLVVLGLLVTLGSTFFGNIHIVTGESISGIKIIPKASFGFSETFINIDVITGMAFISAQSQYPISIKALREAQLIESERQFKHRNQQEFDRMLEDAKRSIYK